MITFLTLYKKNTIPLQLLACTNITGKLNGEKKAKYLQIGFWSIYQKHFHGCHANSTSRANQVNPTSAA